MIIGFKEASNVEIKASVLSALPLFNTPVSIADSFSQFEHSKFPTFGFFLLFCLYKLYH
ncbi:hypothetical protein GLOIN_2v809760 [Rhizophagus irregularis DAOM 181602=DAOM 197198]|uniref:Uncharacterized protein n=1 Tax=Rhizophagus irregularis (strain DAOM 181602 / DAOM 197198 / MUCL 43194) TaxID=747089 RepID=A0A2P4P3R7_RHIID|nr:hypothetical protein GLOIN_2v809760 [Rhizophagus irregularis DAOM 181602=DAOM 197198]POG60036.1 hypothetical protein GLOIN_2v809760 [Rhizophagus irregularis DAOM 181602=DAOM 197198]|eukprot:XP_025166902.1 hypothetical protein GLOIN_2v809760 [Rhizophagus irregularis DAOM 181602=DAOM 197198]